MLTSDHNDGDEWKWWWRWSIQNPKLWLSSEDDNSHCLCCARWFWLWRRYLPQSAFLELCFGINMMMMMMETVTTGSNHTSTIVKVWPGQSFSSSDMTKRVCIKASSDFLEPTRWVFDVSSGISARAHFCIILQVISCVQLLCGFSSWTLYVYFC